MEFIQSIKKCIPLFHSKNFTVDLIYFKWINSNVSFEYDTNAKNATSLLIKNKSRENHENGISSIHTHINLYFPYRVYYYYSKPTADSWTASLQISGKISLMK